MIILNHLTKGEVVFELNKTIKKDIFDTTI